MEEITLTDRLLGQALGMNEEEQAKFLDSILLAHKEDIDITEAFEKTGFLEALEKKAQQKEEGDKQKAPFRIHDIMGDLRDLGGGLKLLHEGAQMDIDTVGFQNTVRVLLDEYLQTFNRILEDLNKSYTDVQCKLIKLD